MRALTEHRFPRAPSRAAEKIRRDAVKSRADQAVEILTRDLQGLDREFVFEVMRSVIRALAERMIMLANVTRAVGVLCGAIAVIAPGRLSNIVRLEEAEALFRQEDAA